MKLQIRLSGAAENLLNNLANELDVKQREVILDALALYNFAAEQLREGKRVGSVDPETKEFTAITTPSLEALLTQSAKLQAQM